MQPSTRSWEGFEQLNGPINARASETDALGGDLRASGDSPRRIAWPHLGRNTQIGGQR